MGEGCNRDEPAEQIRGCVVMKAWLNGLCKGQAESSPAVEGLVRTTKTAVSGSTKSGNELGSLVNVA